MRVKSVSAALVVACALIVPATLPASAVPSVAPAGVSAAAVTPVSVAAVRKPAATLSATYTMLANGKVVVGVVSNAAKVQVKYRTAKNRKKSTTKKLKRGAVSVTLPVGSKSITVRTKATKKLAASPWTTATPPVVAPPAVTPPAVTPPVATPPVVAPPVVPPAPDTTAPGPVTGLKVTGVTASSISLSWTNPTDTDLAQIVVRRAAGSLAPSTIDEGIGVALSPASATMITDSGLPGSQAFSYAVFARDGLGNTSGAATVTGRTGTTAEPLTLLSSAADGTPGNDGASHPMFSPDGTRVVFESQATNLVTGDTGFSSDIFVKTLATSEIQRISTTADGSEADGQSHSPVFSPDGTKVAFESEAANLVAGDSNAASDVFIKTLATGAVERVSTAADGSQANARSNHVQFSPDGLSVAFESRATNLVAGRTGMLDEVFIKNLTTGAVDRVSTGTGPNTGDPQSFDAVFSPDGTRIAFVSSSTNLVPGDTNSEFDIFVKTLATGVLQRISTAANGNQASGGSSSGAQFSPDGSKIAFLSTATDLIAGDTNAASDVFVKDLAGGTVVRVSTDARGAQTTPGEHTQEGDEQAVFSPDGTRVAFTSYADNLVSGDTNTAMDVFVKTLSTGAIERVSTTASGAQAEGGVSHQPMFAPDGAALAFSSWAANVMPGVAAGAYLKQLG